MATYCAIGPDSRGLLNKLGMDTTGANEHRWVLFDRDIQTDNGLMDIQEWLVDLRPDYVLIDLKEFDQHNCKNEQTLSAFLEEHSIPAQFLVPEKLGWHNVKALANSAQLKIHEFTLDRLRGQELINSIQGFITVYHMEPVVRSYQAH